MTNPEWPQHFPATCPPGDAVDLDNVVLYLVGSDPPTSDDFVSATERGTFVGKPECERASLSCGLTQRYIEQLKETVPRLRPMLIAEGDLKPEHGKLKPTGKPGHHSMWLRRTSLQAAPGLFRVVK